MKKPSPLDDGSVLRDKLIVALVNSGICICKQDGSTYELTDADGTPYVYDLPDVVGYRLVQMFIEDWGLSVEELTKANRALN